MLCKYFFFCDNWEYIYFTVDDFYSNNHSYNKVFISTIFYVQKKKYICIEKRSTSIYNIILKIEKIIVYSCPEILLSKCCLKLLNYIIIIFLYFWIDK